MDGGVGWGREQRSGLVRCGSGMRESGGDWAGWMRDWDEGDRKGWIWMDVGMG